VKGYFDAWSVHPYSQDRSPLATGLDMPELSFSDGVPAVRKVMRKHGDHRPLWLTEFGYSTCAIRGQAHWQNCVDPSVQARYLRQAFRKIQSWSYVPVAIYFNLKDTTGASDDRTGNHGLLRTDDTKKPSFEAFQDVARELRDGAAEDPPVSGDPPPSVKPPVSGPPKVRRRAVVHVARRDGFVSVKGRTPRRGVAKLLVYRLDQRADGFPRNPTYRWRFRSQRRGRFGLRLHGPALRGGTWLIVVRPTAGAHWRMGAAILDG
jgi:hypothetical protein